MEAGLLTHNGLSPLRWAIVGTGFISNTVAEAIHASPGSMLSAVAGRTAASVEAFARRHGVARHTTAIDELLVDPTIDVIYVGTPNHAHHPVVMSAAAAGKPVLSEKSLTRSMETAGLLVDAVTEHGTLFVEGLMYLAHPMYERVADFLTTDEIGELRSVSGWYHADIHAVANPAGGGTIYNLGCYPVSLLHLVVQTMCGSDAFGQRSITASGNRLSDQGHDTVVDAALTVRFANGVLATLQSSDTHGMDHGFAVSTSRGLLRWETNPWLPEPDANAVTWVPHDGKPQTIQVADGNDAFFHQVQMIERLVAAGATQANRPSPRPSDSLEILGLLTEWEAAV